MRDALAAAAWLNAVMALLALAITAVPVMAPAIADDVGIGTELVGAYTALMWTASIVTSVTVGWLVGRFGALRVAQLGLAATAVGLLAGGAGPWYCLAVAAVLIGLAQGAETPSASTLLLRLTHPGNRTLVFSIKQTGGQLGGMLAGLVLPLLLPALGWRGTLLVLVPVVLTVALLLERPRARYEPQATRASPGAAVTFAAAVRMIRREPALMRLAVVCISYITAQTALVTFLVSYLVLECGQELHRAGMLMAMAQAGGLAGRVLWGAIPARSMNAQSVLAVIGAGMVLSALALGLFGRTLPYGAVAAVCVCFGMTAGGWHGVHIAETARLVPGAALAQVTGAIYVAGAAGLVLGPVAFSAVAAAASFGTAYVGAAACAAAGVLALLTRSARTA